MVCHIHKSRVFNIVGRAYVDIGVNSVDIMSPVLCDCQFVAYSRLDFA